MKKLLGILVLGLFLITPSLADTEESKESIPEWFIKIPKTTEKMVYARGTAVSSELIISQNLALSAALKELCIKISSRITVTEKINSDGTTTTIESVVGACGDISEYEVEKIKIVPLDNGNFRTFLILKYPISKI